LLKNFKYNPEVIIKPILFDFRYEKGRKTAEQGSVQKPGGFLLFDSDGNYFLTICPAGTKRK